VFCTLVLHSAKVCVSVSITVVVTAVTTTTTAAAAEILYILNCWDITWEFLIMTMFFAVDL